jgi:Xaa-Pro aminopeptidase
MRQTTNADIVRRLNEAVSDSRLDALIATSFENVLYLSGTAIHTQRDIPDRLALVVWTADRSPKFIVCTIEEAQARAESWIPEIIGYTEFADSPVKVLADVLKETVPQKATVAIEKHHLTAHYYEELVSLCPGLTFVSADELLERVRMIKTPSEIAILGKAAMATDKVIRTAFEGIRVGDTERDIATGMEKELRLAGADFIEFDILATGRNAKLTHPFASETQMLPGQVVRTDFGGRFNGYLSDIARTAVVRPASDKQRSIYQRLFEVHERVIASIRPGLPARELFAICERGFEQTGLDFKVPHIGHGLGVSVHEHPLLSPFTTEPLQTGMVLCLEPLCRSDDGIFHVEDLVEVVETGTRVLSRSADWGTLLEVG